MDDDVSDDDDDDDDDEWFLLSPYSAGQLSRPHFMNPQQVAVDILAS